MKRRKTLFVRHSIQWKYLRLVLLAMFGPALVTCAGLYYLIWQVVAYHLAIPELIAESLFPAFRRVNEIIFFGVPIVFALVFLAALRLSHRLAGPLRRIETDLEEMVKTRDFTKSIRSRPSDELQSLISKMNRAIHAAAQRKGDRQ